MRLANDRFGTEGGRTIVLLHGLTSSRSSYRGIVPALVERGCRGLNVDLRGHGETGPGHRYRADDYAADVIDLLDEAGIGPAVLVGHSLGGVTATAVAVARPDLVSAVFLEDPPLFEGDDKIRQASPAARFFPIFAARIRGWQEAGTTPADVAEVLGNQPSPLGGRAVERLGPDRMLARADDLLAFDPAAIDAAIGGETWQGYDPLTPLPCPVTVVAADPDVGAVFLPDHGRWFTAANPQARIETITGQAHGIHDDPDGRTAYLAALDRFLAALP